ncbi:MAG: LpxD N-terminal domain-containing protein [Candidatus Binatia bacterium]
MSLERTLTALAAVVGGKVIGDGDVAIRRVAPIDEATDGEITFLTNPRYAKYLDRCRASAVIVGHGSAAALAGR